jgi:putative transposase
VTVYTVFVIHLASRRVQILGSTPHPDEAFMRQVGRTLTMADAMPCRILICDRDTKWSGPVPHSVRDAGIRLVQTPYQAPNANAYAERFCSVNQRRMFDRINSDGRASLSTRCTGICRATISNGIIKGLGIR